MSDYTPSGSPTTSSSGDSAVIRAEFVAIQTAINSKLDEFTDSAGLRAALSDETGTGAAVFATSPTLVTPALGTPASGVLTNCTGTASGLTAGNVTTNANLTGPITSVGNATSVASQTGTGSTFVMAASPTLTTPNLGTPSALVGTNITGTAAGLTAGTVTTNANLTGDVTSVGNAATIANDAVTYAKMQDVSATDKVLGRSSLGSGNVEEIACTAAGRALIDDASADAQCTTLGVVPEIGTYATLQAYSGARTSYYVRGSAADLDGGAGLFRVDASDTTSADNGGSIIVDASSRRWKRDDIGSVNVLWFGAVGDGATNNIDAFVEAADTDKQVIVPDGDYVLTVANQTQLTSIFSMLDRLHIFAEMVTITIASGVYTETVRTDLKVTNGDRLKVTGATPTTLTFSSLVSVVSNGAGDHDVTFAFSDASSVSVNDYLIVRGLAGTKQGPLEGVWKITAKASNNVTVKNTAYIANLSTGAAPTVSSGTFKKLNTVINYTGTHGLYVNCQMGADSVSSNGFHNLALIGNATANTSGIFLEYGASITLGYEFGVHGFGEHGAYAIYAGLLSATNVCFSNNGANNGGASGSGNGAYALAGSVFQLVGAVATGNDGVGMQSSLDACIAATGSNASGNDGAGYSSASGASIIAEDLISQCNTSYGVFATTDSFINGRDGTVTYNTNYGVRVITGGKVDFNGGAANNNTTADAIEEDYQSKIIDGTFSASTLNGYPARTMQSSVAFNFGSIAANSQSTTTITIAGVTVSKCNATVNSNGTHVAGLVLTCHPSATNTITIIASNITTGAITVGNRTYYVTATMHP